MTVTRVLAVSAIAVTLTSCSSAAEWVLLSRFFAASRLRDHTSLQTFATVSFEPNVQGIITDEGKYGPMLGDRWKAQIAIRIDRFVGLLRRHHAMVYWVGLPKMRDDHFDADIHAMNLFYTSRMAALDVPYIETFALSVDANGQYAPYLPVDPRNGAPVVACAARLDEVEPGAGEKRLGILLEPALGRHRQDECVHRLPPPGTPASAASRSIHTARPTAGTG